MIICRFELSASLSCRRRFHLIDCRCSGSEIDGWLKRVTDGDPLLLLLLILPLLSCSMAVGGKQETVWLVDPRQDWRRVLV
jgi:hypothetical protein